MNKKNIIWSFIFLLCYSLVQAQVIKSEKSYLRLNNKPKKEAIEKVDKTPPEIKIISPAVTKGVKYKISFPEINLIGKATDENEVISVIVNSEIKEVSKAGVFTASLSLVPGDNEITVIAMDNKDNYLESKFIIEYSPPKLTLADKINKESKYYGLFIGVNNYEDAAFPPLDNPIQDAQKLFDVLTTKYIFNKENVQFIKDAKREDIINSLDELAKKVTSEDNLLIFYAGHGWWDKDANIGYWLPSDARQNSKADWFRNSTLVDYLKEVKSKHTLLIADACFGGAIFKTRTAFPDAQKAINKLYELPSRKAMTSGTLTEVPDRSVFINFLVERLENNTEKYLSSEQLFSSFRIAVINNSDVIPQYGEIRNVGDQGGDFIFIIK
ncbi:MAG: caspase family protein [Bacteroidales bacterium]|nr:caspase family protein [Bacteroidales bacterium]